MEKNAVIQVDKLVKRYGENLALDHFNLKVYEGEIVGLLGPNGSGKTTAINSILSLLKYDKGEIKVFSEDLTPHSYELKNKIGVIPQEVALFDNLTVYENIEFFSGLYIKEKGVRLNAIEKAIEFVGLDKYRKYLPKQLSGGLKRRLNIACGIAHQPKLIFFDEPTVAVDAQSRNFILEGIKQLKNEGATIVYTTHYLDEAEFLCDRIVIMDSGQSVASGSVEDLQKIVNLGEIITLELLEISEKEKQELKTLSELNQFEELTPLTFKLTFEHTTNNITKVVHFLEQHHLTYTQLYSQLPDLNAIFLELTGKELRD